MITKISTEHREKPAYIYVRQSTLAQVRHHHESTERQYALKDKALELGWSPSKIRILDADLGRSGAQINKRKDFKTLVADVSMGQVGAIFALEASRLARSNLDWHRLLELCALTSTLVVDEDGCYEPGDFNDGLLLGLKGTMAQAELHFLRGRLQGGKLNKAKKGELRFPLPVGYCHDDQGHTVLDPDQEVQGVVRLVFQLFREKGSAYGVVHAFSDQGLSFPKRAYGGAWDGQLVWGRLAHSRVLGILKNPCYAGTYVFGRYQSYREISKDGEIQTRSQKKPMEDWRVVLKDHHGGYIDWDEYVNNQERLAKNRTNGESTLLSGSAREGMALLQGLLICSNCGRRLTVRYTGNGGIYPTYQCNWRRREGMATAACMTLHCDLLDAAVSQRILEVIEPSQIQLALAALEQFEERDGAITRQWRMRLDRAEYEAQLAERRYQEVDPSNRLVANTLERRWNDALTLLEERRREYEEFKRRHTRAATPEQKEQVLALAQNFPRLWAAPTTEAKDRKRMLRLLIQDITVEWSKDQKIAILHICWQGKAIEDLPIKLPRNIAERIKCPEALLQKIRELCPEHPNAEVAEKLNQEGLVDGTLKPPYSGADPPFE